MARANWFVIPLLACGLATWTVAAGQATTDQGQPGAAPAPLGPQPGTAGEFQRETEIEIRNDDDRSRDLKIEREVEVDDGRLEVEEEVEGDASELRRWAGQEPARPRTQMREPTAATTRPSDADLSPQATRRQSGDTTVQTDIYIFEDGRAETPGYWGQARSTQGGGQGDIYAFRDAPSAIDRESAFRQQGGFADRDVYGFSDEPLSLGGAAGGSTGVPSAVIHPVPEGAGNHSWSKGRNLLDDNLIQTRDTFDIDRDFYTKEWKVSAPPLVMHPRFHTIYDNTLTQQYYTPWHGSPVVWSPNRMTPVPLPQTRNQLLSSRQKWTYFDSIGQDRISNTPAPFALSRGVIAGSALARGGMLNADVYAFQGDELDGRAGMMTRGSAQPFYFDDLDLVESGAATGGGVDTYGFVSPEGGYSASGGMFSVGGDVNKNIPRSSMANIYGVPTAGVDVTEDPAKDLRGDTQVYGYTEPEVVEIEHDRKIKTHKSHKDKDCD